MTILNDTTPIAKKSYRCNACYHWDARGDSDLLTDDERLIIEAARADNWRILPGQRYRKLVYVDGGDIVTYRARIGMDSICNRLELFDE